MLLTEMTIDDRYTLKRYRIQRMLHFFSPSLPQCLIELDAENELTIHCPHSSIVDELLEDLEDLCHHAWLILGAESLSLYFCQEEILRLDTYRNFSQLGQC